MITPNKQNLILLKKQRKVIQKGQLLLKEKRTGLVFLFLELAKEGKMLEQKIGKNKLEFLDEYNRALNFVSLSNLKNNIDRDAKMDLHITKKRISGVYLENFNINIFAPKRTSLKTSISDSFEKFTNLFPDFLMLVQLTLNVEKIAIEIEKTNRLINNLEKKVESIIHETKVISTTLNEKENLEKATLIKIFT